MGRGTDEDNLKRIDRGKEPELSPVLENHQSPALLFRSDGRIVSSNGSAQKYFSCRPDDFQFLRIDDLLDDPYSLADLERKGSKKSHLFFKRDGCQETAVMATANVLPGYHLWLFEQIAGVDRIRPMLSERERQILSVLADGANNGEIAYAFGIARTTVQQHIASLKRKLEAATRAQMIERAIAHRLLHHRSENETSLIQEVLDRESCLTVVNYIDHNTMIKNPDAAAYLSQEAKTFIFQDSLKDDIALALDREKRQAFIEKEVRLFWQKKNVIAEGFIDPLPGGKFILRLSF